MEAKKSSSKQVVAILLLVIGLAAGVFGVLGLVGGGGMDPYEARNGVVYVQAVAHDDKGSSLSKHGDRLCHRKAGRTCGVYCDERPCGGSGLYVS